AIAEEWGPVDRSHRKLAHRGSYEGRVWVAPSTFRRVLAAHGLVLMVSRYWITTLVSPEETSSQVRVVFDQALLEEGLDELLTDARLDLDVDDPDRPILLAVSDNGPAMTSIDTRARTW